MDHTLKLDVEHFTDPLCGWCYGMEPAVTALRYRLGDKVDYHYTFGLMMPDFRQIMGYGSEAMARFESMKEWIDKGYATMENTTGMPYSSSGFDALQPDDLVTVNSSVAYHAVKIAEGPDAASRYLHALRQAAFAYCAPIGKRRDVDAIVESCGVDMTAYNEAIDSGQAESNLYAEVARCHSFGIHSFPTLILTYGSVQGALSGYQTPEGLFRIVSKLTEGYVEIETTEYSPERALELIDQFGRVSGEELRATFGLTKEGLQTAVTELKSAQLVDVTIRGKSFFLSRQNESK